MLINHNCLQDTIATNTWDELQGKGNLDPANKIFAPISTSFSNIYIWLQVDQALIHFSETYRCCGAEIGDHHLGYFIWTDHANLKHKNAVPKSCCIRNSLNKLVSFRYYFFAFVVQGVLYVIIPFEKVPFHLIRVQYCLTKWFDNEY